MNFTPGGIGFESRRGRREPCHVGRSAPPGGTLLPCGSVGRAPDSGSGGRRFEPFRGCQGGVAQLVEQMAHNHRVAGSSPASATMERSFRGLGRPVVDRLTRVQISYAPPITIVFFGDSQAGTAQDFGSCIRRFESCSPIQRRQRGIPHRGRESRNRPRAPVTDRPIMKPLPRLPAIRRRRSGGGCSAAAR